MDTENKLTVVRGEGVGGLGEKDEWIKQKQNKTNKLIDTDDSMVIMRGKVGSGRRIG